MLASAQGKRGPREIGEMVRRTLTAAEAVPGGFRSEPMFAAVMGAEGKEKALVKTGGRWERGNREGRTGGLLGRRGGGGGGGDGFVR